MEPNTRPTIDTAVPISIHVDNLSPLRDAFTVGHDAQGKPIIDDAFNKAWASMETLFAKSSALSEADRALKAMGTGRIDPAQERRLRAGAEKALADARQSVETALGSIAQHRAKAEEEISAALMLPEHTSSVVHSMRAESLRRVLLTMPKTARLDALRASISQGRVEPLASVLSIDALASGLDPGDLEALRMDGERKFAAKAANRRDALIRLGETLARAGDANARTWGRLVGRGSDPHARAEAALRNLEGAANA